MWVPEDRALIGITRRCIAFCLSLPGYAQQSGTGQDRRWRWLGVRRSRAA